jgi:hypothetical protein
VSPSLLLKSLWLLAGPGNESFRVRRRAGANVCQLTNPMVATYTGHSLQRSRKGLADVRRPPARPAGQETPAPLAQYRSRKIIDLQAFAAGRKHATDQQASVISPQSLADLHPAHAIYAYAQNQASVLLETITALPALDKLTDLIVDASEEYMPSGPPMSPLTSSYFFYWSCFRCGDRHGARNDWRLYRRAGPLRRCPSRFPHGSSTSCASRAWAFTYARVATMRA